MPLPSPTVQGDAFPRSIAGLLAALAEAPAGGTVILSADATYSFTEQVDVNPSRIAEGVTVQQNGAVFIERGDIQGPLLRLRQHGVSWLDMRLLGSESDGNIWIGSPDDQDGGLVIEPPDGESEIRNVVVAGSSESCTYGCTIRSGVNCEALWTSQGHLRGDPVEAPLRAFVELGGAGRYLNYNAGLRILGGRDNVVRHASATDHGQALLVGLSSRRLRVMSCFGDRLFDNGIYLSSAIDFDVRLVSMGVVYGSAFKSRGPGRVATVRAANAGLLCTVTAIENDQTVEVGMVDGGYRVRAFYVDDFSIRGTTHFLSAVKVKHIAGHRIRENGNGNSLSKRYANYFKGATGMVVKGGPVDGQPVMRSFTADHIELELGDLADLAPGVDPANPTRDFRTTVAGVQINTTENAEIGRVVIRSTSPTPVAAGVKLVECRSPLVRSIRGEGLRRVVRLFDTTGATITVDLEGATNTLAIEELGTSNATVLSGNVGAARVRLTGPSSAVSPDATGFGID